MKNFKTKPLVAAIFCVVALAAYGYSFFGSNIKQLDDSRLGIQYLRQLITDDNKTSRTIMWESKAKQHYKLEYRSGSFDSSKTVAAEDVSFKTGDTEYLQYKTVLKGLKPGTTYEYRIVTADAKGAWHKLTTDDGKGFTALIFSDAQSADYSGWHRMAKLAYNKHPESKLYLNLGDQVDCDHSYQWEMFFKGIEPFGGELPAAMLVGNHECYNDRWEEIFPKTYLNLFHLPGNGYKKYQNQFYSFDYGDVHFTVLDTGGGWELDPWEPYLNYDQRVWLEKDLAAAKARWKVVLMHRDIFIYQFSKESGYDTSGGTYFIEPCRSFMRVFDKYSVDVVLTGHLHTYRRRVPLKYFQPNPKGTLYIMTGISGDEADYGKLWADFEWDAKRSPEKPENGNYMTMKVDDNSLTLKAYLKNGKEFDTVTLKK